MSDEFERPIIQTSESSDARLQHAQSEVDEQAYAGGYYKTMFGIGIFSAFLNMCLSHFVLQLSRDLQAGRLQPVAWDLAWAPSFAVLWLGMVVIGAVGNILMLMRKRIGLLFGTISLLMFVGFIFTFQTSIQTFPFQSVTSLDPTKIRDSGFIISAMFAVTALMYLCALVEFAGVMKRTDEL